MARADAKQWLKGGDKVDTFLVCEDKCFCGSRRLRR
jgi:hypothetical protein